MKKKIINNKYKYEFSKLNYFFNKKSNLFVFLLIFLGAVLSTLSGSLSYNFWYKLFDILNNPIFNMLFFISIGLNVIYMMSEFSKSYLIVSRYKNFPQMIKKIAKDISIYTLYLYIISLIIAISGAIIFSFGNFNMINHPFYDIPIIFYIIFYIIRNAIIICIINLIIYLLLILFKKIFATFIIMLNSVFFFILFTDSSNILHFYNIKIIYHYYFTSIRYSSFLLEIVCSFFEIFVLAFIYKIFYKYIVSKKRDLI